MELMEIFEKLKKIGFRVIPESNPSHRKYEIIIEPWDYRLNKKQPGKRKKTGYMFSTLEVNKKDSPYWKKLTEIQLKLINHFETKPKL